MSYFFNTSFSTQQFLDEYWQKKPLLIRQAFLNFSSQISPDELAGLACQEDVESRLIQEQVGKAQWQCAYGPFQESDFEQLPESNWTLLVQDVDKHLPEFAELMQLFEFIPEWRRDDLMISFAPEGGSVGPHTDGYDVFLLQAEGQRRWQISDVPMIDADLIDGIDLRILAEFKPDQTWVLEPGDMLYLPPHFAHHGVALNDCMTYSIGFRSPKQIELLDVFLHNLMEKQAGQKHYTDPHLNGLSRFGEVDAEALTNFKMLLSELLESNEELLTESVGKLLTETKPSLEMLGQDLMTDDPSHMDIESQFKAGHHLLRNPYLRLVWVEQGRLLKIFAAGEMIDVPVYFKQKLCQFVEMKKVTETDWLLVKHHEIAQPLFEKLISTGIWYWQQD